MSIEVRGKPPAIRKAMQAKVRSASLVWVYYYGWSADLTGVGVAADQSVPGGAPGARARPGARAAHGARDEGQQRPEGLRALLCLVVNDGRVPCSDGCCFSLLGDAGVAVRAAEREHEPTASVRSSAGREAFDSSLGDCLLIMLAVFGHSSGHPRHWRTRTDWSPRRKRSASRCWTRWPSSARACYRRTTRFARVDALLLHSHRAWISQEHACALPICRFAKRA